MIAFVLFSLAWIYSVAVIDAEHFEKQQYVEDHTSRFFSRLFVGFLVSLFSVQAGLLIACLFWVSFDSTLNVLRGLPLLYRGENASTDKMPNLLWIGSKIICLIAAILIIIF